ncbi:MAG: hypothetical protein KJ711_00835, partial [Candidatus Omnitrophica bacterium]|nr:hypothetical protein [Candidatus Omnitrophota bacterium]
GFSAQDSGRLEPHRVNALLDMGVKPVYRITTKSGKQLKTTLNHPYLTKEGWKKLKDIKVGEEIAVIQPYLHLRGASSKTGEGINVLKETNDYRVVRDKGLGSINFPAMTDFGNEDIIDFPIEDYPIASNLETIGINRTADYAFGKNQGIRLTKIMLNFKDYSILDIFRQLQEHSFGLGSKIVGNHLSPSLFFTSLLETLPDLRDSSREERNLGSEASISSSISSMVSLSKTNPRVLPLLSTKRTIPVNEKGNFAACDGFSRTTFSSDNPFSNDGTIFSPPYLKDTTPIYLSQEDLKITYEPITSIESLGNRHVYDIEVEGTHNFVAQGIVAHNTVIKDEGKRLKDKEGKGEEEREKREKAQSKKREGEDKDEGKRKKGEGRVASSAVEKVDIQGSAFKKSNGLWLPPKNIVLPKKKNFELEIAKGNFKKAIEVINAIQRPSDLRTQPYKLTQLQGYLDEIFLLKGIDDQTKDYLKTSLKTGPLFLILASNYSGKIHQNIYRLLEVLRPNFDYTFEELNTLLESIDVFETYNLDFSRQIIDSITKNLALLSEDNYRRYLRVINRLPRQYYRDGIPQIPPTMTFGIELELFLVNPDGSSNEQTKEATKSLYLKIRENLKSLGVDNRNWVVKEESGGEVIEITNGKSGLSNDKAGFEELSRITNILEFIAQPQNNQNLKIGQCLHIHVGNPQEDKRTIKAVAFIGKSMEYWWAKLSRQINIKSFKENALLGEPKDEKGETPFYSSDKKTIAFNSFAAPACSIEALQDGRYLTKFQQTISIALSIVYNASMRADEFNLLRTGLPVYQQSVYSEQNSYLLRKHLSHLFKDNPEQIISVLQLLLNWGSLAQLIVPQEFDKEAERIEKFYRENALAQLYELNTEKGSRGWNEDIKNEIEKIVENLRKIRLTGRESEIEESTLQIQKMERCLLVMFFTLGQGDSNRSFAEAMLKEIKSNLFVETLAIIKDA